MFKRPVQFVWLLLLAIAATLAHADHAETEELRIAVAQDQQRVAIVPRGVYRVVTSGGANQATLRPNLPYSVELSDGGVVLRDRSGRQLARDERSLKFIPEDRPASSIHVLELAGDGKPTTKELQESRHYRGTIEVAINRRGTLTAVNYVGVEEYVYGVVGPEIGRDAPLEAMKAQAIVARSEAMAKIHRGMVNDSPLFDFTDSPMVQVYRGKGAETPRVRRAVDETRGQILTWDHEPIDAVYSHSCGGVVAVSTDLWDGKEVKYTRRAWDRPGEEVVALQSEEAVQAVTSQAVQSYCYPGQVGFPRYAVDNYRWKVSLGIDELSAALDGEYGIGRLKDAAVEERSASGRVRRLRLTGSRKSVVLTREMEIRRVMGNLRSTFFSLTPVRDAGGTLIGLTIQGAGFGHGVGMCQMGAYMMARRGARAGQILKHYFPNAKLELLERISPGGA